MKSKISKKTYMAIYRLLDKASPISTDCGVLCDAACCNCGGDSAHSEGLDFELGIYLLPGEEKVFTMKEDWLKWSIEYAEDYDFPDSWFGKIYFVRCKTPPFCSREMRPLQCRFFPLAPHISKDGILHLIISPVDLPYICPLIKNHIKLENRFIKANYTVWKRLIKDNLIYDLVKMDSSSRDLISLTYII